MTTLITGASSGIGEALALASARRGEKLFLSGRDEDRLAKVAAACKEAGAAAVGTRALDITDAKAVEAWITESNGASPLDRVFANAGIATGEETNVNARRTFETNVMGTVNTVLPALAAFRKNGAGQLILTASIAGYGPLKSCPSYSATKSCIKTWGLALRGALKKENIRVSVVAPGFIRSRLTAKNTCPMPFFMEADKAAKIILSRADRNIGLIAFPWPMRFATWLISILPASFNEFINRFIPEKVSSGSPKTL